MAATTWVSNANGGWSANATWNRDSVPSGFGNAAIINTTSVFFNVNFSFISDVTVNGNGVLVFNQNKPSLDIFATTNLANNATINISNANATFTTPDLNITGGTFNDSGLLNVTGGAVTANGATVTVVTALERHRFRRKATRNNNHINRDADVALPVIPAKAGTQLPSGSPLSRG